MADNGSHCKSCNIRCAVESAFQHGTAERGTPAPRITQQQGVLRGAAHTFRSQELSVQLWGDWEGRSLVLVPAGIHREHERRQLSARLDQRLVPLRPRLPVLGLQCAQKPAAP